MNFDYDDYFEIDDFNEAEYEEERQKETFRLNQMMIQSYERQYHCSFPEFILLAKTKTERLDLITWGSAIRHLAIHHEKLYA